MRHQLYWILVAALRLLYPHIVPIWMLLRGRVATIGDFILWPFLYILLSIQLAWFRLRARRCETEPQTKLSRKVYNIEAGASFLLGLYEGGAALALSIVPSKRTIGELVFVLCLYFPYVLLTLWGIHALKRLSTLMAVQHALAADPVKPSG